jgi:hypothetical protein
MGYGYAHGCRSWGHRLRQVRYRQYGVNGLGGKSFSASFSIFTSGWVWWASSKIVDTAWWCFEPWRRHRQLGKGGGWRRRVIDRRKRGGGWIFRGDDGNKGEITAFCSRRKRIEEKKNEKTALGRLDTESRGWWSKPDSGSRGRGSLFSDDVGLRREGFRGSLN